MMKEAPLFIANWKMNKSFSQAIGFCEAHLAELSDISAQTKSTIVLCPSFPALQNVARQCADTPIKVGAQTCSPHAAGTYTGQVSAESLKEAGCSYVIVGHSEQREHCNITSQNVASAAQQVIHEDMIPIVCIGETTEQNEQGKTADVLAEQLEPVLATIDPAAPFCIAYEPVWAIGSGQTPDTDTLATILRWIRDHVGDMECTLLYGGSVNGDTAAPIFELPMVQGFLIGGASLDFQKLQNIVLLSK